MVNLQRIRIFIQVVETGSFSSAGRQLGLSPSSVSRRIGELENELGVRLFQRTTRQLRATEQGQIFYQHTLPAVAALDEARKAVSEIGGAPGGVLKLSVPNTIGRLIVAPLLPEFYKRYPNIDIVLSMSDKVVDMVADGVDLAMRVGPQKDSSLIARKLGVSMRVAVASPDYLEQAGRPEAPDDLVDHNCLTFRHHPGQNIWTFEGAGDGTGEDSADGRGIKGSNIMRRHDVKVSGSLYTDNAEGLCAAALAGLGIILVPLWLVRDDIASGRLERIMTEYAIVPEATPIYAVYPQQRHLAPKVRAFVDFMVEHFDFSD